MENQLCSACKQVPFEMILPREEVENLSTYDNIRVRCRWRNPGGSTKDGYLEGDQQSYDLGSTNDVLLRSRWCVCCNLISVALQADHNFLKAPLHGDDDLPCFLHWMRGGFVEDSSSTPPIDWERAHFQICVGHRKSDGYQYGLDVPTVIQVAAPQRLSQFFAPEAKPTFFCRPRQARFDPGMLRQWLQDCEKNHGERCRTSEAFQGGAIRLIDTRNRCLKSFDLTSTSLPRYLTLSYVWGVNAQRLTLRKANLGDLYQDGALNDLPRTIWDAIYLVTAIGERYLWVDALCIVQDDPDDQKQQIPQMCAIYRCSLLTIVAAAGDNADVGLPGVTNDRSGRNVVMLDNFALATLPLPAASFSELGEKAIAWKSRAWTFQEELLSIKLIYFLQDGIQWKCETTTWYEELDFEGEHCLVPNRPHPLNPVETELCIDNYRLLLLRYTSRRLTHETDIANAFSGILEAIAEPFFWGIPISTFEKDLLYHHHGSGDKVPMTRRNAPQIPSWSWMAWKGQIERNGSFALPKIICYQQDSSSSVHKRVSDFNPPGVTQWEEYFGIENGAYEVRTDDIPAGMDVNSDYLIFWADCSQLRLWPVAITEKSDYMFQPFSLVPLISKEYKGNYREFVEVGFSECIVVGRMEDIFNWPEFLPDGSRDETDRSYYPGDVIIMIVSWTNGVARKEHMGRVNSIEWFSQAHVTRVMVVLA